MASVWLTDDERPLIKAPGGTPAPCNLINQDDGNDVRTLGAAITAWVNGDDKLAELVKVSVKTSITSKPASGIEALALGRNLPSLVFAADLVGLNDGPTRDRFRELLRFPTAGGPTNVIDCHNKRANNWGLHGGGARVAVDLFTGDDEDLELAINVFRTWLGDPYGTHKDLKFTSPAEMWAPGGKLIAGINPMGAVINGHSVDGVLPDDQRRSAINGGKFTYPFPKENYVHEALQGAILTAVLLVRHGFPAHLWGDQALLRAYAWLYNECHYPASGDDGGFPALMDYLYSHTAEVAFSKISPPTDAAGKNVGWLKTTHGGRTFLGDAKPPINPPIEPDPIEPPVDEPVIHRSDLVPIYDSLDTALGNLDALLKN